MGPKKAPSWRETACFKKKTPGATSTNSDVKSNVSGKYSSSSDTKNVSRQANRPTTSDSKQSQAVPFTSAKSSLKLENSNKNVGKDIPKVIATNTSSPPMKERSQSLNVKNKQIEQVKSNNTAKPIKSNSNSFSRTSLSCSVSRNKDETKINRDKTKTINRPSPPKNDSKPPNKRRIAESVKKYDPIPEERERSIISIAPLNEEQTNINSQQSNNSSDTSTIRFESINKLLQEKIDELRDETPVKDVENYHSSTKSENLLLDVSNNSNLQEVNNDYTDEKITIISIVENTDYDELISNKGLPLPETRQDIKDRNTECSNRVSVNSVIVNDVEKNNVISDAAFNKPTHEPSNYVPSSVPIMLHQEINEAKIEEKMQAENIADVEETSDTTDLIKIQSKEIVELAKNESDNVEKLGSIESTDFFYLKKIDFVKGEKPAQIREPASNELEKNEICITSFDTETHIMNKPSVHQYLEETSDDIYKPEMYIPERLINVPMDKKDIDQIRSVNNDNINEKILTDNVNKSINKLEKVEPQYCNEVHSLTNDNMYTEVLDYFLKSNRCTNPDNKNQIDLNDEAVNSVEWTNDHLNDMDQHCVNRINVYKDDFEQAVPLQDSTETTSDHSCKNYFHENKIIPVETEEAITDGMLINDRDGCIINSSYSMAHNENFTTHSDLISLNSNLERYEESEESEEVYAPIDAGTIVWSDYKISLTKDNDDENINNSWIMDDEDSSCSEALDDLSIHHDDQDWITTERSLNELKECLDVCCAEAQFAADEMKYVKKKSRGMRSNQNSRSKQRSKKPTMDFEENLPFQESDLSLNQSSNQICEEYGCFRDIQSHSSDALQTFLDQYCKKCVNSIITKQTNDDDRDYYSVSSNDINDVDLEKIPDKESTNYLTFGKSCNSKYKKKKGLFSFLNIFKFLK